MWKSVLVGTMALAVAGSSLLYAQQVAAPAVEHDHWRPSAADLNAFTDARIAALKVGLQLTPDQRKDLSTPAHRRSGQSRPPGNPAINPVA